VISILGFDLTPTGWFVSVNITIAVWLSLLVVVHLLSRHAYTKNGYLGAAVSLLLLLAAVCISVGLLWTSLASE